MSIFEKFFTKKAGSNNTNKDKSSEENLKDLHNKLGFAGSSKDDETQDFMNYWNSSISSNNYEEKRKINYALYKKIDEDLSEITITLDTYADEIFYVGFTDNPVEIFFTNVNKEVKDEVLNILERNNIFSNQRADARNLCKFGDMGYRIIFPEDQNPKNLILTSLSPDKWKAVVSNKDVNVVEYYELEQEYRNASYINSNKQLDLHEFVQFSISDSEFTPYGKSLLEGLKTASDHLLTVEALLALSRASKVERLVLRIPVDTTDATAAYSKMNMIKSQWKNTIFRDNSNNLKSSNKTPSLQEVLYLPAIEGFSIEKLQSSIDLSSIEDVEYFRDKLLIGTRLPKAYFASDESRYMGGGALSAMDLKFSRALIPYQKSYAKGLTRLCLILVYFVSKYKGIEVNLDNLNIEVKVKRSPQIASELLEVYTKILDTADRLMVSYKDNKSQEETNNSEEDFNTNDNSSYKPLPVTPSNNSSSKPSPETPSEIEPVSDVGSESLVSSSEEVSQTNKSDILVYCTILSKLGMPEEICGLFLNLSPDKEESSKSINKISLLEKALNKERFISESSNSSDERYKKSISEKIDKLFQNKFLKC